MKSIGNFILAACLALVATGASAQAGTEAVEKPFTWTLQECIDWAKQQNITVQRNKVNVRTSQVALQDAKANRLPTVNFSTSQYVSNRPFQESYSGVIGTEVVSFSNKNSYSGNYSVDASMNLYNGGQTKNNIRLAEINSQLDKVRELVPVATVVMKAQTEKKFSEDNKYIQALSYEDRNAINAIYGKGTAEPDFYHMAREKFTHWYMVLVYLLFFAVLGLHLRHGFSSAFQTLGLNNYKYNKAIEIIGIIYTWCICLIFSLVALGVFIPSL